MPVKIKCRIILTWITAEDAPISYWNVKNEINNLLFRLQRHFVRHKAGSFLGIKRHVSQISVAVYM